MDGRQAEGKPVNAQKVLPRAVKPVVVALAIALVAIGAGWSSGIFTAHAQDATSFTAGQTVVTTDSLTLRSDIGTASDALEVLPPGAFAEILDGPTSDGGYFWYLISFDDLSGYVAGEYLADAASTSSFATGDTVTVTTDALNLRDAATTAGTVTDLLGSGAVGTVVAGPVDADGYAWYQLDVDGVTGWAVRNYLAYGPVSASDTGTATGSLLVNTDPLNLRDAAGTSGAVLATLAEGDSVTATGNVATADGYDWAEITTADGTAGWVVADYLTSDANALLLTTGATGYVDTDALTLRDAPGLAATSLGTLVSGDVVTIISASEAADGYLWYQVETATGTGWVAGSYLTI
jgi:uncharacterized protein YgiM (DUF1202 family)